MYNDCNCFAVIVFYDVQSLLQRVELSAVEGIIGSG